MHMEMAQEDRTAARATIRTMVADNLRMARQRRRLKQETVADEMRRCGFQNWSRPTVSEVERYRRPVSVEELFALSEVLETEVPRLLARDASPEEAVELIRAFGGKLHRGPRMTVSDTYVRAGEEPSDHEI